MNIDESLRLDGRGVFITGAGNGLGRASALLCASHGARVGCADLDGNAAAAVADEVRAAGGHAEPFTLDVTDRGAVTAAVDDFAGNGLYGVVTIAGIPGDTSTIEDLDLESFERIFATHFSGTLNTIQAALPYLTEQQRGSIVTMASGAIDLAIPGSGAYAIAKASIAMLTKVLAAEVGRNGIRANILAPGFIPTGLSMVDHDTDDETRQRYQAGWAQRAPLRTVGVVDDIGHQVLYLLSDASRFVTGQILRANGGATMPW
ncbi:SDR family NAD(P)-dependent oxidoreductase [Rhodococcus triatomae]|nr:3-oxoacyl-ACP reductase [Rhodococcus triatomae BKS 15-14]